MQRMHSWAQRRDMIDRGRPNRFGEGGRPDGGPGEKGGEPSANRQAREKVAYLKVINSLNGTLKEWM